MAAFRVVQVWDLIETRQLHAGLIELFPQPASLLMAQGRKSIVVLFTEGGLRVTDQEEF
jgi:hypothetical protein